MKALAPLLLLCACARLPVVTAIPSNPWPTTAPPHALADRVRTADGFIVGTVERTQTDWTYDPTRGGPHTHLLTIRATDSGKWYLRVFVPEGNYLPLPVGTMAVFIWRFAYVMPYLRCDERRGVTLICAPDRLPVLQSLDDVAAPGDSSLVAALFAAKVAR